MTERLRQAYDPEVFRAQTHALVDKLAEYLTRALAGEEPVVAWREAGDLAELWAAMPGPEPITALPEFADAVIADALHQHHPRCFGHQVSVPLPTTAANAMLIAVLSNGMASYDSGPLSSALERNITRWLTRLVGMPDGADGVLTSGGTLGNLTALLAARHETSGFEVESGQRAPLAVIASSQTHYCIARAAMVMGWGADGVIAAPVDESFRLRAESVELALRKAREAKREVVAVVATAGASSTGAFDPIDELADVCARHDVWLHVDGAHGASAAFSSKYRGLLDGIERADSVVWDAHKLLGLPALTTAVLFRRGASSCAPFAQKAEYLFSEEAERGRWFDFGLRNMECTKRMMSVELYGMLAQLGTNVIDDYVTGRFDLARDFATLLEGADDFALSTPPTCNIVCFRHLRDGVPLDSPTHEAIRERLLHEGAFFITRTVLHGDTHLRVTLMNPRTRLSDLEALLDAIRLTAQKV